MSLVPINDTMVLFMDNGLVHGEFAHSLGNMIAFDYNFGGHRIGTLRRLRSSANVSRARNSGVEMFLDSGLNYLFLLDTDHVFAPDLLTRLHKTCSETDPIVGALTWLEAASGEVRPNLIMLSEEGVMMPLRDWPKGSQIEVFATGAACLLIHRSILVKIQEEKFSDVYPFFQEGSFGGGPIGEDVMFCVRARKFGVVPIVDTAVEIGHIKHKTLTVADYPPMAQAPEPDYDEIARMYQLELDMEVGDGDGGPGAEPGLPSGDAVPGPGAVPTAREGEPEADGTAGGGSPLVDSNSGGIDGEHPPVRRQHEVDPAG